MKKENQVKVRINTVITGEPATWLLEWKRRGIVTSNTDAIIQAFRAFHEEILKQDLMETKLKNMRIEYEEA